MIEFVHELLDASADYTRWKVKRFRSSVKSRARSERRRREAQREARAQTKVG